MSAISISKKMCTEMQDAAKTLAKEAKKVKDVKDQFTLIET